MGTAQEATVRSLVECMNADDRDVIAAQFAEDATWHMIAWREPLHGRAAIRAALDQLGGTDFRYTITNLASTASVVFAEIVDTHRRDDKEVTIHWTSVTEINEAGKITAERDYWDSSELAAQLT
jgi:limonene-1,2-epoxide hydrolase